ncbi:RNA polymerase sigma-70 factor, partial [uncultured Roseivirga sp.]
IVQSTFVNLWEKREMIKEDINFKSYLFRAAYNTALNYIKHEKVVNKYVNNKQESIEISKQNYVSHQPDFELQKRIEDALDSLPPQCQKVFRMSREEGLKYHEIADELGISKKTVEVHMGKALKILRGYLQDYMIFFLPLVFFL